MLNRKGQNTAEYAILIALVVAAAVAMQVYVRRGVQGRMKDAVDHTGAGGDIGGSTLTFSGKQFEPSYIDSSSEILSQRTADEEEIMVRGGIERSGVEESTKRKAGGYEKQEYEE